MPRPNAVRISIEAELEALRSIVAAVTPAFAAGHVEHGRIVYAFCNGGGIAIAAGKRWRRPPTQWKGADVSVRISALETLGRSCAGSRRHREDALDSLRAMAETGARQAFIRDQPSVETAELEGRLRGHLVLVNHAGQSTGCGLRVPTGTGHLEISPDSVRGLPFKQA